MLGGVGKALEPAASESKLLAHGVIGHVVRTGKLRSFLAS